MARRIATVYLIISLKHLHDTNDVVGLLNTPLQSSGPCQLSGAKTWTGGTTDTKSIDQI